MKRRLQLYLERTFGSAYGEGQAVPATTLPPEEVENVEGKKERAAKVKPKPQAPPDGGRFDLRFVAPWFP